MVYKRYYFSDYVRDLYNDGNGYSIEMICFKLKMSKAKVEEWCGLSSNGSD